MSKNGEIMDEFQKVLEAELDRPYVMTVDMKNSVFVAEKFYFRKHKTLEFVVSELDDGSFTFTWFTQPKRVFKRILDDIGIVPIKFRVEKGEDNEAVYRLY